MAQHNWPVYGHDWAVEYLLKGMQHDRIRHAYLIAGTPAVGKMALAKAFAMALNCQDDDLFVRPCGVCRACKRAISGSHMDLLYTATDERSGQLRIDAIRTVTNQLAMKPYEGRYRVAIMDDFDRAQPRAQDALLKTLEEPPPYALLILLARSLEPILSTITSRSQIIHLRPVPAQTVYDVLREHYGTDDDRATLLAQFSGGRIGWAIAAAQNPEMLDQRDAALNLLEELIDSDRARRFKLANDLAKDKSALATLLELWGTYWRDVLLQTEGASVRLANADREVSIQQMTYTVDAEGAVRALKATQTLLGQLQYNINTRLALETMLLDYPGLLRE